MNALHAIGLLGDRASIAVALENLASRDPAQRANALETLEATGERWRAVVRPLLPLWETSEMPTAPVNAWLRACAALVARDEADSQVRDTLAQLACTDPDTIVRETAALSLNGGSTMDTLPTLSLRERILFLRRVPLCNDQKQFEGLLRERPETSLAVMRVLCTRLKENQNTG